MLNRYALDNYGRRIVMNPNTGEPRQFPVPDTYQVDQVSDSLTYIRYFDTNPCMIRRVLVQGTVTTIAKCMGDWTNRTTQTYIPINQDIIIEG